MKKKLNFYFASIGLLMISSILLSYSTVKILFNVPYESNSITSDFSYVNKKSKKSIGFEHVKLKQFDFYNFKTNEYEYFLNDYGKKYLIQRFMETAIIGPEMSALNNIVISDTSIIAKKNLGEYYTISNSIFINIFPFLKNASYQLLNDINAKTLQERRVEAILFTIIHEYYHHFFSSYVSSPIGYNEHTLPKSYVKMVSARIEDEIIHNSNWNQWFYDRFKALFFSYHLIGWNQQKNRILQQFLYNYISYIKEMKNNPNYISKREHFQNVIDKITRIAKDLNQNFYNIFKRARDVFQWANEGHDNLPLDNKDSDKKINIGMIIDYDENVTQKYGVQYVTKIPKLPVIYKTNFKQLAYFYSMEEQVVRKLLSATFIPRAKYKKLKWEYLKDYLLTGNYIRNIWNSQKSPWQNFYNDNIYPSKPLDVNRSKRLINEIIKPVMGYENHSHLSFITVRDSWRISSRLIYSENKKANFDHKKIKMGGFIDDNGFNYVGYKNADGTIVKFAIYNKKFNIWHKKTMISENKVQNETEKFYWYTKDFIDISQILDKKLYFFKVAFNESVKSKAFTSIRKNKFGIVNSFNDGMMGNSQFIKNTMNKDWNDEGGKWLVVGDDSDGVKLKFHNKQEAIEKIWT